MPGIREAVLVLAAAALAGCAVLPPAAVMTYTRKDCPASADLTTAISLAPPKEMKIYSVTTQLAATAPCLSQQGGASPYLVYALPADIDAKTLTVGSILEQVRLVAPDISILDRQGKTTRRFTSSDYFFRGSVYSVQFRPRPGEAYVLVATDPTRVGRQYDSIAISTSTTSTYSRGGSISWTRGVDQSQSRTFSYEGSIEVTVYDELADKKR